MAILELANVWKGFNGRPVLRDLSFGVAEGEFLAILGFSGSGKTTLINLLAGLSLPDRGVLRFMGADAVGPGPERGLVFQSYALMPWLTVEGNIRLAVDATRPELSRAERAAETARYIAMVGLSHAAGRRPAELSGGMRQRVAVARALALRPEVLLMDEPLSALDALTRARVASEIESIWRTDRRTAVLITNDVDEALILADRILCLNPDGSLGAAFPVALPRPRDRASLDADPAYRKLRAEVTACLMDAGVRSKVPETRSLPSVTPRHALKDGLPGAYARAANSPREARYLHFSQLHKTYPTPQGPLSVVQDFNLTLRRGEFVSLIGHSGCGKSTVLSMTAGLTGISEGAITLDGIHVTGADPERAVVFQSPNLFPWLSAKQNVAIGVDRVYPGATQAERQEVVEYYLERVGLADAMDRPAADMSNGMRQRVGIARAFALSPKLLLLDEPFGMLDSLTRWELQEVLMEVWSRTKVTAICVTHDVDEAILLADRVVMMTNGPRATIGRITQVDLPRPRSRRALLDHPDYARYRAEVMDFLTQHDHRRPKTEAA